MTSSISLHPVLPEHYPFLYRLATTGLNAVRWRYRGQIPPYEVFVQQIHQDVLLQFAVQDNDTGELAGHVVAYGADHRNRLCYVGVVIDQPYVGTKVGSEALAALIRQIFEVWDFRKVYAEVPEFTFTSLQPRMDEMPKSNTMFEVEGCLKEYFYNGGRYWDMYQVAASREAWTATFGNI